MELVNRLEQLGALNKLWTDYLPRLDLSPHAIRDENLIDMLSAILRMQIISLEELLEGANTRLDKLSLIGKPTTKQAAVIRRDM